MNADRSQNLKNEYEAAIRRARAPFINKRG